MKHLKNLNLFVVCMHLIIFCLNMGLGINLGFVIDTWFTPVFGAYNPLGTAVAIVSGVLIGLGSFGLFLHSERAWRVIGSIENTQERTVRYTALIVVNLIFIAVGILGLIYRLSFFESHNVVFLIWIGALLDASQPLFGLVLYPMTHMPSQMVEDERLEQFESTHVDELYSTLGELPLNRRHEAYTALKRKDRSGVRDVIEREVREEQARVDAKKPSKKTRVFTDEDEDCDDCFE